VSPKTIRRDGRFAAAVNQLVEIGGWEIRNLILARDARVTRGTILALAAMANTDVEHVRRLLFRWQQTSSLPRNRYPDGRPLTITLRRGSPEEMGEDLQKRLEREEFMGLARYLQAASTLDGENEK
jgi:hypothetical protein